jgi:aspartyl-tRNA(Asn)/glutamyl-tRNA(Gln) amidotransferase subunit C
MQLSEDDVRRVADLARIALPDAEAAASLLQLRGVFGLIEQLLAADTDGVEPMAHPLDGALRLRDDEVTETDRHALFQSVAPQVEDGLYLVPKVIE